MKNLFWVKNKFNGILSFIGTLGLLTFWAFPSQALSIRVSFDGWIGLSPMQKVQDTTLFNSWDFSSQIEDLIPSAYWLDIKTTSDFSAPVQSVGDWLVIMAKPHYGSQNDLVILIDRLKQKIIAICFGSQVSVVSSNEIPAFVSQKMEIEYHLAGGHVIAIQREVPENCANNNAKFAVERWLQAASTQSTTDK